MLPGGSSTKGWKYLKIRWTAGLTYIVTVECQKCLNFYFFTSEICASLHAFCPNITHNDLQVTLFTFLVHIPGFVNNSSVNVIIPLIRSLIFKPPTTFFCHLIKPHSLFLLVQNLVFLNYKINTKLKITNLSYELHFILTINSFYSIWITLTVYHTVEVSVTTSSQSAGNC